MSLVRSCGPERRKHPRLKIHLPLELTRDAVGITTETRNLSCAGVYCRTKKPLPLMSKVAITMFLPSASSNAVNGGKKIRPFPKKDGEGLPFRISCVGVVVRSEPIVLPGTSSADHDIAIFFTDLAETDRKTITKYVQERLSKF